mgnify:CR=1 FL=1
MPKEKLISLSQLNSALKPHTVMLPLTQGQNKWFKRVCADYETVAEIVGSLQKLPGFKPKSQLRKKKYKELWPWAEVVNFELEICCYLRGREANENTKYYPDGPSWWKLIQHCHFIHDLHNLPDESGIKGKLLEEAEKIPKVINNSNIQVESGEEDYISGESIHVARFIDEGNKRVKADSKFKSNFWKPYQKLLSKWNRTRRRSQWQQCFLGKDGDLYQADGQGGTKTVKG